ncbi:MAG: hypothetical protein COC09_06090 [Gammaproteobacteria bacterium]|nr:hypothetical protein [Gammaproteobacteria bacterium]PCH63374.1 MAG: hypothetical protein COC09_06090 [Gammaproteobacteria bacterium]
MKGSRNSRRKIKRWTLQQFDKAFDLTRLDFNKRMAPARHKPKLTGVIAAAIIYGVLLMLGNIGISNGAIDQETLAKMSWVIMVPSSAIGIFVYMLVSNRRQYDVLQDMKAYIALIEKDGGLFWRFEPLVQLLLPDNGLAAQMVEGSRVGDMNQLYPEDYGLSVHALYKALGDTGNREIPEDIEKALIENFTNKT